MLADANRTRTTNTYCMYTVLTYSWWWTVDMSETCRVLFQISMRNSAFRWLSLSECITTHGPLNVKRTKDQFEIINRCSNALTEWGYQKVDGTHKEREVISHMRRDCSDYWIHHQLNQSLGRKKNAHTAIFINHAMGCKYDPCSWTSSILLYAGTASMKQVTQQTQSSHLIAICGHHDQA